MTARLVQTVHGNTLGQLITPRLRQGRHFDVSILDRVEKLYAEHVGGHALINRHDAVMLANVVLGLAPPVPGEPAAHNRGDRDDQSGDNPQTG